MESRIWDYLDGRSNPSERLQVEDLLKTDIAWRSLYDELREVHDAIAATHLEGPSLRFTRNVMEEIGRLQIAPATRNYINKRVVWGIGLFFILLVLGFLIYGFGQMDWSGGKGSSFAENLGKVDVSRFFSNTWVNAFMMVNVVLGLVLLDHYLRGKSEVGRRKTTR